MTPGGNNFNDFSRSEILFFFLKMHDSTFKIAQINVNDTQFV